MVLRERIMSPAVFAMSSSVLAYFCTIAIIADIGSNNYLWLYSLSEYLPGIERALAPLIKSNCSELLIQTARVGSISGFITTCITIVLGATYFVTKQIQLVGSRGDAGSIDLTILKAAKWIFYIGVSLFLFNYVWFYNPKENIIWQSDCTHVRSIKYFIIKPCALSFIIQYMFITVVREFSIFIRTLANY